MLLLLLLLLLLLHTVAASSEDTACAQVGRDTRRLRWCVPRGSVGSIGLDRVPFNELLEAMVSIGRSGSLGALGGSTQLLQADQADLRRCLAGRGLLTTFLLHPLTDQLGVVQTTSVAKRSCAIGASAPFWSLGSTASLAGPGAGARLRFLYCGPLPSASKPGEGNDVGSEPSGKTRKLELGVNGGHRLTRCAGQGSGALLPSQSEER